MQLKLNTELQNGKYRIISVLGQGGFGITYLAEHTMLDKMVAIKEFFPKDFCGRDNMSQVTIGTENNIEVVSKLKVRFLKEVKNLLRLDHPGIVKVHDVFEDNNTAYIVMDYIEGESLSDIVKKQGHLSEEKSLRYICKIGDALEYIHSQHMTHFDVKPANIMVRKSDDNPILIDFGLSKQYDINGDATSTLMQGISNGYSPIELYNSDSVSTFSPQTDVYSLAATFYYLITGIIPPGASEILSGIAQLDVSSICAKKYIYALTKGLESNKSNRTQSVKEFINDLNNQISISVEENTQLIENCLGNSSKKWKQNNEEHKKTISMSEPFVTNDSKYLSVDSSIARRKRHGAKPVMMYLIIIFVIICILIAFLTVAGYIVFWDQKSPMDFNPIY